MIVRPPKRARKAGPDQLHEAGQHHQVDVLGDQQFGEFGVPGGLVGALDEGVDEAGHARLGGPLQVSGGRVVGAHHGHLGPQFTGGLRVQQSLQETAGARDQHGDAEGHGRQPSAPATDLPLRDARTAPCVQSWPITTVSTSRVW